ncbi:unnamed protein product [Clonostachys byssicola]|uniref:Uncharacterized protein n=1 Tax=Clonostachys byssicola TaxID=160290 RepID=A0A9N9XWY4_9HYPO|nr:unnamed protein product [Clonostachys byssicola]
MCTHPGPRRGVLASTLKVTGSHQHLVVSISDPYSSWLTKRDIRSKRLESPPASSSSGLDV